MSQALAQALASAEKGLPARAFAAALGCELLALLGLAVWLHSKAVPSVRPQAASSIISLAQEETSAAVPKAHPQNNTAQQRHALPRNERSISAPILDSAASKSSPPDKTEAKENAAAQSLSQAAAPTHAQVASFEGKVRAAVQAAVGYPQAARMMQREGRVLVAFDYLDAHASNLHVTRSSGFTLFDDAAIAAVRNAHLPPPPAEFLQHLLRMQVWVEFELNSTR